MWVYWSSSKGNYTLETQVNEIIWLGQVFSCSVQAIHKNRCLHGESSSVVSVIPPPSEPREDCVNTEWNSYRDNSLTRFLKLCFFYCQNALDLLFSHVVKGKLNLSVSYLQPFEGSYSYQRSLQVPIDDLCSLVVMQHYTHILCARDCSSRYLELDPTQNFH